MKTLKQLALLPLLCGLLLTASCDRDNEPPPQDYDVQKLPSRITMYRPFVGNPFRWNFSFQYDEQNRLTKIVSEAREPGVLYIFYSADNTLEKFEQVLENGRTTTITFQHNGNQIIANSVSSHHLGNWTDTLWLNENGQVIQLNSYSFLEYNASGNLVRFRWTGENGFETEITYTNIPTVWRYANIPAWIFDVNVVWFSAMYPFAITKGYMVKSEIGPHWKSTYSYTLGDTGYPKTATFNHTENTHEHTLTIEYILAN